MSKRLQLTIIVISVLVILWYAGIAALPASRVYSVEAVCSSLPPDDIQWTDWLKTQPGIVPRTVTVKRNGTEIERITITFIQVRSWFGPQFPKLEEKAASTGYVILDPGFTDVER